MYGQCEICHRWSELDRHHVFGGMKRQMSEKYGAVIFVCRDCHNNIHHKSPASFLWLKKQWQRRLMEEHEWDVYEFIRVFGRSYE